ncbi:hypothetical protein MMC26_003637 [Xylographa opegraphella]|nr:hypothetical protein [Xylographa opegraphella]
MTAIQQSRPTDDANYLFQVTMTEGHSKGSNRLYSIPQTVRVADFVFLVDGPPHLSINDMECDTVALILPVMLGGHQYSSSIDISKNAQLLVGDVDSPEFHILVTFWVSTELGEVEYHLVKHSLQYIGRATAHKQGKIACLSGSNFSNDRQCTEFDLDRHMRHLRTLFGPENVA